MRERDPCDGQHISRNHGLDIYAQRWRGAQLAQPARDRVAVPLSHFVFRRDRERDATIDKARQSFVGKIISVDDVDIILNEIFLLEHIPTVRSFGGVPPWCIEAISPNSRANRKSWSATSNVEECGPRIAKPRVSSWSCEANGPRRRRSTSLRGWGTSE